jgi:arylsulfatase A-like enzyme
MVKCIDDNVGKILAALRTGELLDHTIVVFTSDHGDLRGEHGRQNKGVPYEGSAKIPFVIYCPGKIQPGTVIDEALGCVDFLPTILSLMGVESAGREEGRDASQLFLTGRAPDDWNDVAFFRSTGEVNGWLAAVTDRYKLILSTADDPWLFDLEKDPDELTNVFADPAYRETVRQLARQLATYGRTFHDPRAENEHVRADIVWAVSGTGPYVSPRPTRPTADAAEPAPRRNRQGRKKP